MKNLIFIILALTLFVSSAVAAGNTSHGMITGETQFSPDEMTPTVFKIVDGKYKDCEVKIAGRVKVGKYESLTSENHKKRKRGVYFDEGRLICKGTEIKGWGVRILNPKTGKEGLDGLRGPSGLMAVTGLDKYIVNIY